MEWGDKPEGDGNAADRDMSERGGWVYIVTNRPHGILYVGVTSNLARRVWEHRSGAVEGFTRQHGLSRLVFVERFEDIAEALRRERRMKRWLRAWKVRVIELGNPGWEDLYDRVIGG